MAYTKLYPWALLIIALITGGIVLSTSSELKILEDAFDKQAQQAVAKNILQQTYEKYPQLSPEEIASIAQEEAQKVLKNKETKNAIKEAANQQKALFQEDGTPYLLGTDTYYYLRYAENILLNGHQGETLVNNAPYDTLRRAPEGMAAKWSMLPAIEAAWHRIWNTFSTASLIRTTFYLPVALGLASIALIFALALTIYKKTETAFFAAILLAVHPYFFRQNMAGFADTPSLIMPLSLAFFLSSLWIMQGTQKQRIIAGICALISLVSLAYTWHAWYYVLAIIAAFCIILPLYSFSRAKIISILTGTAIIIIFFLQKYSSKILTKLQIFNVGAQATVKELTRPDFPEFTAALGDTLFSLLLLIAACWTGYRVIRKQATRAELFLFIWLLIMLLPAARILRFMFFLIPPAIIMTAGLMQKIQETLANWAAEAQIAKKTTAATLMLIILPFAVGATMLDTASMPLPPMTAATTETGEWLKQNAKEDAIINTWWDYGYIWQYASQRATTLDAAPGTRTSRWTAKALLSENATYSRNILRMTACSRAQAESMTSMELLEQALKQEPIPELANLTHCAPREAYIIIDKHTLDVINTIEAEALNTSEPVSSKAPSGIQTCEKTGNTTMQCWGYTVDIEKTDAFKKDRQPFSITIITNGTTTERALNPESEAALIVYQEENKYRTILVPPEYRNTLLVRLFTGAKTEHFTLVHQSHEPERITTWKINLDTREEPGQPSFLLETLS